MMLFSYDMMKECWSGTPEKRPSVSDLRERLRQMLESIVKEKDDMYLDPNRSYYNVNEAWDEERISEEVQPEESAASEADKGGQANEAYVEDDSAFDPVKPTLSLRQTAVAEAGPIVPYPRPTRPRLTSPSVTSTDSFANSFDSDWSDRRSDGPLISPHHGKVLNDYKGILNNNYTLDPLKEQDIYGEKQVENDSTPPEIQTGTAYVKL